MLKIYYGPMKDAIYNTSVYFDNTYLDTWLEDDFSKKMVKSIDKAEVIGPQAVNSKVLGVIPATQLSGGLKTLLLMYHKPEMVYYASQCGDNCAKWILRIAKKLKCDLTINLRHIMDFGDRKFDILILNDNTEVHNMAELVLKAEFYL
ncbi:MAG: DUF4869 domain-containing protein [Oribacterium sp.]|nr:DUF4869 domain-containing protein [Oribacterium sp.]